MGLRNQIVRLISTSDTLELAANIFETFTAEASRSIKGGGFYVNNGKVAETSRTLQESDLLDGRMVVLAIGKGERKILYLT